MMKRRGRRVGVLKRREGKMGGDSKTYHENDRSYCYPWSKTSVCWFVIDPILCRLSCVLAMVECVLVGDW